MQGVRAIQAFTTKNIFCRKLMAKPSSVSCHRHELPSYPPITKYSPSSRPFRTFLWVIKNQNKGSPTVSPPLNETPQAPLHSLGHRILTSCPSEGHSSK